MLPPVRYARMKPKLGFGGWFMGGAASALFLPHAAASPIVLVRTGAHHAQLLGH
jgi:hypothetical protein